MSKPGGSIRSRAARAASALVIAAAVHAGAPAPASAAATARYLDCGAGRDGNGTRSSPWRSLARADGFRLRPGSKLLLRRGSSCSGDLVLQGGGSLRKPALVGAYGRGRKPRIVGSGSDAVLADDVNHLVLERLDVTNPGDGSVPRRGVTVVAEGGAVRDVTLRHLHVHDVGGDLSKGAQGSAGIEAAVRGDPGPRAPRFSNLLIAANEVDHVSRSGIRVDGTLDRDRPDAGQPWPQASSGVVIRDNRLDRLAGDGIVPTGTEGARVIGNVVANGNLAGRPLYDPRGFVCDAGIWTFHANRTVIARNEVYGMRFNGCDGTGYDVDYDQDGTVVQFNLSHDNEGGFVLLCGEDSRRRADVRFNLSVDDGATMDEAPCRIAEGHVGTLSGVRFFNNTIVAPDPRLIAEYVELPALFNAGSFRFVNNIVVATSRQSKALGCGEHCSHNLFFRMPASGTAAIVAGPRFVRPDRRGRGRVRLGRAFALRASSPALRAGVPMPASAHRDYFGNELRSGRRPTLGFFQPPLAR